MHLFIGCRRTVARQFQFAAQQHQLVVYVAPLTHAQRRQEGFLQQLFILVARQFLALLFGPAPQVGEKQEVGFLVGKGLVGLVGLLRHFLRAVARVLRRQCGDNHQHFVKAVKLRRLKQHATEARVHRQARQLLAQRCQAFTLPGAELFQQAVSVAHQAAVWGIDKREILHITETHVGHLQNHGGQVSALDLRIGKRRACEEIFFAVKAITVAGHDAAAAALALLGAGLRDRFHRQPLYFGVYAVAADACGARINDVTDAGHGQRGFSHVGRQHHSAAAMAAEYALLFLLCQACVEWQEFGVAELAFFQVAVGVADIAFAAEEDEHIAGGRTTVFAFVCLDFTQRILKLARQVLLFIGRTIMHRHRIRPPRHLNHRHLSV